MFNPLMVERDEGDGGNRGGSGPVQSRAKDVDNETAARVGTRDGTYVWTSERGRFDGFNYR